jgi:prepilin-type N-terminal cleavage/methylation domain-containing protein
MKTKTSGLSGIGLRRSKGFTLIELMIVVAIVAILTTIAYPNYRDYVIRGQLVDATTALASLRANMERYYQDNRTYITSAAFPSPCAAAPYAAGGFTITCPATALTTFTLQAQGTAGALNGFVFTVDEADVQKTVVTTPPAPATFLSCNTAWVTKTGGC